MILFLGSGCIDVQRSSGNTSANITLLENFTANKPPASIVYYLKGNLSIPINVSQIEVRNPGNFTNVTLVVSILLNDSRAGILLENGWNITSVTRTRDTYDLNRTYSDIEFEKEGLSFFIGVDEDMHKTLRGYSGAQWWQSTPVSGPIPEGYHQSIDKSSLTYHVFDHRNNRVVMIYNQTSILYLYPSYSNFNTEGLI